MSQKAVVSAVQGVAASVVTALVVFGVLDADRANALAGVAVSLAPLFAALALSFHLFSPHWGSHSPDARFGQLPTQTFPPFSTRNGSRRRSFKEKVPVPELRPESGNPTAFVKSQLTDLPKTQVPFEVENNLIIDIQSILGMPR